MLEAAQIRAARALLGWNQTDLAQAAEVSIATIRRIEVQDGPLRGYISTVTRIQTALEEAGVHFLSEDNEAGYGVRLEKSRPIRR